MNVSGPLCALQLPRRSRSVLHPISTDGEEKNYLPQCFVEKIRRTRSQPGLHVYAGGRGVTLSGICALQPQEIAWASKMTTRLY